MNGRIDLVTDAAEKAQADVYQAILALINRFEITDGRYVTNQNLGKRIALLEKRIREILGDVYAPSITEYLTTFKTVEETNVSLQKSYNQLEVEVELLSPARKTLYNQASYYLTDGLADAYIQPAKFLLMQQVTGGISLKDSQKILKRWNDGELTQGLHNSRQTPNLTKYATQVSRDTLYGYYGAVNEIIAQEYDLSSFIYTGTILEDSRELCRHLVHLKRPIELSEMPKLIEKYPRGLYPNTNSKNFIQLRGGYNCLHGAFAVKASA
jgi:hypothetical protein